MKAKLYIGTSGWHYADWTGHFYPKEVKGYNELSFHATYFNTVENNASFYRSSKQSTYAIWYKVTPESYKFSLKLNKFITHIHRLNLTTEVKEKIQYILTSTQVLKEKLGAIVIQLPASFQYDMQILENFLNFFKQEILKFVYKPDVAIEFRNEHWFTEDLYALLEKHNVALVDSQSSRYPEMRRLTANTAYIRMHGPEKLFASSYSPQQLEELGNYIHKISKKVDKIYVYFNNDFHGYALENAQELMRIVS